MGGIESGKKYREVAKTYTIDMMKPEFSATVNELHESDEDIIRIWYVLKKAEFSIAA